MTANTKETAMADLEQTQGTRGRGRFSWDAVNKSVREALAADLPAGTETASSAATLAEAYGSPPREERFRKVAAAVREHWLPTVDAPGVLVLAHEVKTSSTPMTREAALEMLAQRRMTSPFVRALRAAFVRAHQVGPDGTRRFDRPDRIADWWTPGSGAITQLCVWMQENVGEDDGRGELHEGQQLYALKDTLHGERQVIWEGGGRRCIVGYVDFAGLPLRGAKDDVWRDWGAITYLDPPLDEEALRREPVLEERFFGARASGLQGTAKTISREESEAFGRLLGDLPPSTPPTGEPDGAHGAWTGRQSIAPEATFENAIIASRPLWRKLGFSAKPARQLVHRTVGTSSDRHDLEGAAMDGRLIVEVKRAVNLDAVTQIQRYLHNRREGAPGTSWRGALVQGDVRLSAPVRKALDALAQGGEDIPVWAMAGPEGSFRLERLR